MKAHTWISIWPPSLLMVGIEEYVLTPALSGPKYSVILLTIVNLHTHTHTPEKHVKVTFQTYFGKKKIHKQTMFFHIVCLCIFFHPK